MDTKRPTVVTIAAILLLVLSLFVAGLGIANQFGLGGGFAGRQFAAGQFRNRVGNSQNGNTLNGSPSNGFPSNGFPSNEFPNSQTDQGTTPNFTPTRQFNSGFARILRLLRPVTIGIDILVLLLSVVAAIGLFRGKRWGSILAIVLAAILILLTIPGFIRIFSAAVLIENLVRILLAAAVIVLLLLPAARKPLMLAEESINDVDE